MIALRAWWLRRVLRATHEEIEDLENARASINLSIDSLLSRERTVRGELFSLEHVGMLNKPTRQRYERRQGEPSIPHSKGRAALRAQMRNQKGITQ